MTAISPTASGKKKITIDTGSTGLCPPGATGACTLNGSASAKIPESALGAKAKTLGSLQSSLVPGQTSARVTFKVSKKLSKAWREAKKLKVTISIQLAVPGGTAAAQSRDAEDQGAEAVAAARAGARENSIAPSSSEPWRRVRMSRG